MNRIDLNDLSPSLIAVLRQAQVIDEDGKIAQPQSENIAKVITLLAREHADIENHLKDAKDQFKKLKIVVDNTPCTISWINDKLQYMGVNETLEKITQVPADRYIGKMIGFQTRDNYFRQFAEELFSKPEQSLHKELISTLNNETKHFWVVGSKYPDNKGAVIIGIETTKLKQTEAKLQETERLVNIDDLTGLYNMRSMYVKIQEELNRGERFNHCTAVVMLDMDNFKKVNDEHDHLFGSYVLTEIGGIIKKTIRKVDFGARYGGDEFMIVLAQTDASGVAKFCERLREAIANTTFKSRKHKVKLTASLGYAITEPGAKGLSEQVLVRVADNALYEAKAAGRNCCYGYNQKLEAKLFRAR